MKTRGGSFGLVMTVIVTAVVLLLVAKNWEAVAPTLFGTDSAAERGELDPSDTRDLPDLQQTQQSTDAHAQKVSDALEATAE